MSLEILNSETVTIPAVRPLLSIAVPTFNRAGYLHRHVSHHLTSFDALGLPFEILFSDNGSTDDTDLILRHWSRKDPRVRYIRQPRNIGGYGNYLTVMRAARGAYTMMIGDDDLLVPDVVGAIVSRLQADAELVMVQAPWLTINERNEEKIESGLYTLDAEQRFERGSFFDCARFLTGRHIFPEVFVVRTSAIADVIGGEAPFVYGYFHFLANALARGDVLFTTAPAALVTSISADGRSHNGTLQAMDSWDRYRGGIEALAAMDPAQRTGEERAAFTLDLQRFTNMRMQVALRITLGKKLWLRAWSLDRRLSAYGMSYLQPAVREELSTLAGLTAALEEARLLGHHTFVAEERIFSVMRSQIKLEESESLVYVEDWVDRENPVAYVAFGAERPADLAPQHAFVDAAAAIRRFA